MRRALLFVLGACASDPHATRTTPVATASATSSATIAAPIVDAGPKDWMWQLVGGTREVHWRWPNGACEVWRVDPDGAPAEYRGTVFHADGATELQLSYEGGDPPKLGAPRAARDKENDAGTTRVDLACSGEDKGAWYLDAESCSAGGPPPLAPIGCFSAIAPGARENVAHVMNGEVRAALTQATTHARVVWTSNGCNKRVVRTRNRKLYLNDTYLYPTFVTWTMHGVTLEEEPTQNPEQVAVRGGEQIAIGCCGTQHFLVLSFADGVAELRRLDGDRKTERWYIDKAPPADVLAACKR